MLVRYDGWFLVNFVSRLYRSNFARKQKEKNDENHDILNDAFHNFFFLFFFLRFFVVDREWKFNSVIIFVLQYIKNKYLIFRTSRNKYNIKYDKIKCVLYVIKSCVCVCVCVRGI